MVSLAEIKLVQESLPRFEKYGYDVAVELYREVFKVDLNLRNLFSLEFLAPKTPSNATSSQCPFQGADTLALPLSMQARILAQTIVNMASKIDDLSSVDSAIERICHKHVSRDIRAEHYSVVAVAFGTAMRAVMKDKFSEEEFAAWDSAIGALAKIFIERETSIRDAAAAKTGGWVGFRKFVVGEQVETSNAGAKLLLVPVDKGLVCPPGRGQFSCIRMQVESFGTIYHNTYLNSHASPTKTAAADSEPGKQDLVGAANRLALSAMASQTKSISSRLATSNMSGPNKTSVGNPAYDTVISTAAARAKPFDIDPTLSELLVTPGRVISQHATEGAIVELSVPVGGFSNPGMNEAKGGARSGNSLLRNALDKSSPKSKGSPLLRQAALSNASRLQSPMKDVSPLPRSSMQTSPMTSSSVKTSAMSRSSVKTNRSLPVKSAGTCSSTPKKVPNASMLPVKPATTEKSPSRRKESDLSPTNVVPHKNL